MAVPKFWCFVLLLYACFASLKCSPLQKSNVYNEYYLDDICFDRREGEITLEATGMDSAVKLKSSEADPLFHHQHCTLTIIAPMFHGIVVVSSNGYFLNSNSSYCENYVEIFGDDGVSQKFCNFSSSIGVDRTYISTETMKVKFSISDSHKHRFVSMLFTAYDKRLYTCNPDFFQCSNSLCIWKGFIRDGENNCGDLSDESLYQKPDTPLSA